LPEARAGVRAVERPKQPSQAVERDAAGGGLFCPLGRDQPAEQGVHRPVLVTDEQQR